MIYFNIPDYLSYEIKVLLKSTAKSLRIVVPDLNYGVLWIIR